MTNKLEITWEPLDPEDMPRTLNGDLITLDNLKESIKMEVDLAVHTWYERMGYKYTENEPTVK